MPRRTGLGRGLDALIPGDEQSIPGGIVYVAVDQLMPNPRQPRNHFDQGELEELAASIKEFGVIQPVIVSYDAVDSQKYVLIAGERRWLAARIAGVEKIPAQIREVEDQRRLELALVENVQRTNLSPLENAEAYRQLVEDFNLSHEEVAARVSKSRPSVTNTLRLLKLSPEVQTALQDELITEGHARAILALPTHQAQSAVLLTILNRGLNVRQTEELVRKMTGEKPAQPAPVHSSPEITAVEERLRTQLGTKVRLNNHGKGGTIVIHYYSHEELDALVEQILGNV